MAREAGSTSDGRAMVGRDRGREEELRLQLQINNLRMERDELLSRAIADSQIRNQLQKDLIALDDKVKNVMDGLRKTQQVLHDREEEVCQLGNRLAYLAHRNREDKRALEEMSRLVDDFTSTFVHKAGNLCRSSVPCVCCFLRRLFTFAVKFLEKTVSSFIPA